MCGVNYVEVTLNFLSSLLESVAILGAAWIGVRHLSTAVSKATDAYFANYEDDDREMKRFLLKAETEIIVLAQSGVNLLKDYKAFLSERISKKKIKLNFMILSLDAFATMDTYLSGNKKPNYQELHQAVSDLIQLMQMHPGKIEVRIFDSVLAASVVAINLNITDNIPTSFKNSRAAIHFMPYQYHRSAGKSPYTYFLPKHNTQFEAVASSVYSMWYNARCVNLDDLNAYLAEIASLI